MQFQGEQAIREVQEKIKLPHACFLRLCLNQEVLRVFGRATKDSGEKEEEEAVSQGVSLFLGASPNSTDWRVTEAYQRLWEDAQPRSKRGGDTKTARPSCLVGEQAANYLHVGSSKKCTTPSNGKVSANSAGSACFVSPSWRKNKGKKLASGARRCDTLATVPIPLTLDGPRQLPTAARWSAKSQ